MLRLNCEAIGALSCRVRVEAAQANERIGLFINSFSLERARSALKLYLDFRRLLALFRQQGRLVRANYYAVVPAGPSKNPLRLLLDWLSFNVVVRTDHTPSRN
jgi:hypothetical protein